MNSRDRVWSMIKGESGDCLPLMPITMMYAAEEIGKSYREYVTDYNVLVEGQLRITEKFDFDHVGCISDPSREAADCGAAILWRDDAPPTADEANALLKDKTKLVSLKIPDPLGGGRMHDRVKAAQAFKNKVGSDKIVEGWIEGPIAEAADLRGINTIMMDFYEDPGFLRDLMGFTVEMGLQFAKAQIEAGVEVMGIGDAAASLIGPQLYEKFVWPFEKKLIDGVQEMGAAVRMHICGNITDLLAGIGKLNCEIVDIDSMVSLERARNEIGEDSVLLGNMNPVSHVREGTPETVLKELARCHKQSGERFIVGAGCELPLGTPEENIFAMRDYAKQHSSVPQS